MDYELDVYRLKSLLCAMETYCKTKEDCEGCAFAVSSYRCQQNALGEVIADMEGEIDNYDQK
jgi:hypothetical protein